MNLIIKSRVMNREFEFWCPDNGGYIRDVTNKPGTLGSQVCDGGGYTGSCLSSGSSEKQFKRICRSWYRARVRAFNEFGL